MKHIGHAPELGVVSASDTILPAAEQAPISKVTFKMKFEAHCHAPELGVVSASDTILSAAEQAPISKVTFKMKF